MQQRTPRFTIGQLSFGVALVALLLGLHRAGLPTGILAVVLGLSVIATFVSWNKALTWHAAAVCTLAAYPVLPTVALLVTWILAYFQLGHLPRANLDDPAAISTSIRLCVVLSWQLISSLSIVGVACLCGATSLVFRKLLFGTGSRSQVASLCGLSAATWLAFFLFVSWDPFGVFYWFFD
jgi:hypothetical protein